MKLFLALLFTSCISIILYMVIMFNTTMTENKLYYDKCTDVKGTVVLDLQFNKLCTPSPLLEIPLL